MTMANDTYPAVKNDMSPAVKLDRLSDSVHMKAEQDGVKLVPKPDRRGPQRMTTPDCPVCYWPDGVVVAERQRRALQWRCVSCGLSWWQATPRAYW
jgi:hypothetical protein